MSAKAIREADGKALLAHKLPSFGAKNVGDIRAVSVTKDTNMAVLPEKYPWLLTEKLVVKPDQLIKRRGKLGLLKVKVDYATARQWIDERMGKEIKAGTAVGVLNTFIIEPFCAHEQSDEYYVSIFATRDGDEMLFYHEGGIEIGDVDSKAERMNIGIQSMPSDKEITKQLLSKVPAKRKPILATFMQSLFKLYRALNFTYLEINPLVVTNDKVYVLDLAAKLDQTAEFECKDAWGEIEFPSPFGREATKDEAYIAELDAKSGASLKLTILNKKGRIWTMVAGGGASVIYSDTICELGGMEELANYGEYSGAPSESQTYEYAKTVLDLMTRYPHPDGKVLIIGGGIANFTNVAATFKGIVKALKEYQHKLKDHNAKVYVRRGGPNYQEGLRIMRDLGSHLGFPIHVFGPESHMTSIVGKALGLSGVQDDEMPVSDEDDTSYSQKLLSVSGSTRKKSNSKANGYKASGPPEDINECNEYNLFHNDTRAIVFGMQPRAVQGMLDFDHCCKRKRPSVACMVYPFSGNHLQKFYWGTKEIMIPVYKSMKEAMDKNKDADVFVNFASFRSAYESSMEAMTFPQIKVLAIIAEGIPENRTKDIIRVASEKKVTVIGPATVGGIKPGCFKIGNTGGMLDNIISSKLYRPGSVAYVSRSGGMSNELNNIIGRTTNGVYEGVAIGGDRYPGSTFIDHIMRYQKNPNVKMIVLLGEVGGTEEFRIVEALKEGRITKPLVAWCIGTCASMFSTEVQFGHAGALANGEDETSVFKNKALKNAGAHVPNNFDELDVLVKKVYDGLVASGDVLEWPEPETPKVPIDYSWAQELGLIRKPANFVSSISDERGEELSYAGMPISNVFSEDLGLGGVVSLLWFKRRLPPYACKFIEMCLMVTADHGPAVAGAHNTIVTTRAGKDLISSLCSGLLTIGDRFGGALDGAANQFSQAYDSGLSPNEFVNTMRKQHKLIMGIGHRVKTINNPDKRVEIIKQYAMKHFGEGNTPLLQYAMKVETITTSKKPNLILNVDGCIAICFVDLLRNCGCFTVEEANEYIEIGTLNGLFVLGRSLGFIGHYLDQKRLKQGLYRHPWDDISYVLPEGQN
eukprot:Nk52_evm77s2192 gene=Nk52_evmTU77s2192